jgi:hypothetical protein
VYNAAFVFIRRTSVLILGLFVFGIESAPAQEVSSPSSSPREITAIRLAPGEDIRLDGVPDEAVWR